MRLKPYYNSMFDNKFVVVSFAIFKENLMSVHGKFRKSDHMMAMGLYFKFCQKE